MNKFSKAAIVAAGLALASQSVHAGTTPGDLIIGFNGFSVSGNASDYIADLGAASTIIAGGPNEDLSAPLASSGLTASSGLNAGVVGGFSTGSITKIPTLFTTTLRLGGGSYTSAGTETAPDNVSARNNMVNAAAIANGMTPGSVLSSDTASFSSTISLKPATDGSGNQSFVNYLYGGGASGSVNNQDSPLANFGGSSTIVEDLWENAFSSSANPNGAWTYEGDITINLSGSTPVVTFDAASVPEPTTYGMIAGGGLLLLALRRQFVRSNA